MRTISLLGLATVSALAFAPAAFAQDTASDTASGKHWAVVGGGVMLQPKDDAAPGIRKVDGGLAPTISGSYFFNDNLAVELWGAADKLNHRVSGPAGKIGTVDQQPVALSAQYHFGAADDVFRPFVGVGYYESNFTHEKIDGLAGTGNKVALDDGRGVVGDGGTVERLANALLKGGRQHGNTRQSAWQNSPGREGKARALRRASLSARRWTDLQRAIAPPPRASAAR